MEFKAQRERLLEALGHVAAGDGKGVTAYSDFALLRADKDVTVTSICGVVDIRSPVYRAEVLSPGDTVVKIHKSSSDVGATILEHVRAMPEALLRVSVEKEKLRIMAYGHARSREIPLVSLDSFPSLSKRDDKLTLELPAKILRDAIKRVLWSCGTEGDAPAFVGFNVHAAAGKIILDSTNSKRGTVFSCESEDITGDGDVFVTGPAIKPLMSLLDSLSMDYVSFYASRSRVHVECDAGEMSYALPEINRGGFRETMTQLGTSDRAVSVSRAALADAAKAVHVGVGLKEPVAEISICDSSLVLLSRGPGATNREEIQVDSAENFSCHVDATQLATSLSNASGELVEIVLHDDMHIPLFIREPGAAFIGFVGKADPAKVEAKSAPKAVPHAA